MEWKREEVKKDITLANSTIGELVIEYIKHKFIQLWNILSGKDKNWDGHVDIKDKMIEAEQKVGD